MKNTTNAERVKKYQKKLKAANGPEVRGMNYHKDKHPEIKAMVKREFGGK